MWPADRVTRASRTVLRVLARMVPPARRPSWLSEWEAELWQLRSGERGTVGLIRFLSGAGWHGLYESWEGWNVANSGQDIRYAARMLRRSPGFTLAAVVLLGSSIGASTALFSVLERAVLADPPFPDPDRLVVVDQLFGDTPASMNPAQWSYPRFVALTEEVRSLETAAGFSSRTMTLTEVGQPVIVSVEAVTPSYFPLLGIDAVAGRAFGPDEVDGGSAELVALVSHGFWTSRLGADPQVAGSTLVLDQVRLEVVGVLPPGFEGITGEAQIWIPMSALREIQDASFLEDPWNLHFNIVARLAGRRLTGCGERRAQRIRGWSEGALPRPGRRVEAGLRRSRRLLPGGPHQSPRQAVDGVALRRRPPGPACGDCEPRGPAPRPQRDSSA